MQAGPDQSPHATALSRRPNDLFLSLFERSPEALLIVAGEGGGVVAANDAARRLYGYAAEEMARLTLADLEVPAEVGGGCPTTAGAARAFHRTHGGGLIEVEYTSEDVDWQGRGARLLRLLDLGERCRQREMLDRIEHTEVMSRLAAMVAHDFGNLLSVIICYADLIAGGLHHFDPLQSDVSEIRNAGETGALLTRQLLAFSRRQVSQPQVLNPNMHVGGVRGLLARFLGERIELALGLGDGLGNIEVDPVHLQQVLLNLVVNARDAMPEGGRLVIATENVTLDEASARRHFGLGAGHYVMLAVSDTGCGMDDETQRRAFEPFYTTKGEGKGTGLGLSIVSDIVAGYGGGIYLYSVRGVGTTFKIYLPRVFADVESGALSEMAQWPTGAETVLLVEDEEAVRLVIRQVLEAHGYTVLEAMCGREALAICRGTQPIHLVITDVMMPRMGGFELANELRALRPQAKLLLMSGYAGDHLLRLADLAGADTFLQKPIFPGPLLSRVREMLDRAVNWGVIEDEIGHSLTA